MSLRTLNDVYFAVVERQHARVMLEQLGKEWGAISSDALRRRVAAVAGGLQKWGIGRGDRVAILSENRPEWTIADFACLLLGAVTVPIYATLTANQTRLYPRRSGARVVFVSSATQLQKVLSIRDQTALEKLVVMDASENAGAVCMAAMEPDGQANHEAALEATARAISPDDLATIIYTSGTTGTPKGAMLSHGNMASNITCSLAGFSVRFGDLCISFLPLSHVTARHRRSRHAVCGELFWRTSRFPTSWRGRCWR